MERLSEDGWKNYLQDHPEAHILQTPEWGRLKEEYGWRVEWIQAGGVGAQVLFQQLPLGFSVGYIPRGPVLSSAQDLNGPSWDAWVRALDELAEEYRPVFIKVETDLWEEQVSETQDPPAGFRPSVQSIQPSRTLVISLAEDEDQILSRMKSKTRYNIRLAGRKEVVVEQTDQIKLFYEMLEKTSRRADFGIHSRDYYTRAFELLRGQNACALFVACYQDIPLASIMVFKRGSRSWYFYGASTPRHRDRMPTYRIQWEAMRWAKSQGCLTYDLWGVPDEDFEVLEDHFLDRSEGLWGVYRFKRGFGGDLKRTAGPWDRVYRPVLYRLYNFWVRNR